MSFTGGDRIQCRLNSPTISSPPPRGLRRTTSVLPKSRHRVFVGYGIVAPEYGWDDYTTWRCWRGKTILMLINDPPIPDPKDPSEFDDKMFKGKAMKTYYGRWVYKYEIAAKKGAVAAIISMKQSRATIPLTGC